MQTDLLLGLMPTPETERLLLHWRTQALNSMTVLARLPPLIPLAYIDRAPSFDQLRKMAHCTWKAAYFAEKVMLNSDKRSIFLTTVGISLQHYRKLCLKQAQLTEILDPPGAIVPCADGFYLGTLLDNSSDQFGFPPIPSALSGRVFRSPLLCLFRIINDSTFQAEMVSWEILARLRVKKQTLSPAQESQTVCSD